MRTSTNFIDEHCNTLTSMPSLNYFHFESIPSITLLSALTKALHSYSYLTNLYCQAPGIKACTSLDYSCYISIEKMCLDCSDFIIWDELAYIISRCKPMKVLALKISSITATGITTMFDSLSLLLINFV